MQVYDVMQETLKWVIASVYISKMDMAVDDTDFFWCCSFLFEMLLIDFNGILSQGQIGLFTLDL